MMNQLITSNRLPDVRMTHLNQEQRELLPIAFSEFVDTAATATDRATFYNTRAEQEAAIESIHRELFTLDRGVYAVSLLLPGLTDFSRQTGVVRLLRSTQSADMWLTTDQETRIVHALLHALPPQRMLKLFGMLRQQRVNNARTRRLILSTLLGASNLEFWAVKYRQKLKTALTHAWGQRTASILRSVLAKPGDVRTSKECYIARRHLGRFVGDQVDRAEQCVRFILGDEQGLTLKRLVAYRDAKQNLECGRLLPFETLEGLRSRYHQNATSDQVLALTKAQLTVGQKIGMQRKAQQADVDVAFDPSHYDAVRLYVYAFEMGMTDEIRDQLVQKAREIAQRLPVRFEHAAILLDVSGSMMGHETQAKRPMAVALALRDLLAQTAERCSIVTSDGRVSAAAELIDPAGDTSLAGALVAVLKADPDVVFVLTDGYENAPAGRFAEVVRAVRQMGVETPIHQFSPVFAAESRGIRSLCESVPGLPVNKPEAIGLGLVKALFETDVDRGVAALLGMVRPQIESHQQSCLEEVKNGV